MFKIGQIEGGVARSAKINAIYIERDAGIDLEVDRTGRNARILNCGALGEPACFWILTFGAVLPTSWKLLI